MHLQILQHDLGRFLLAMLGVILFPGCAFAEETAIKVDRDHLPPTVKEETGEIEYILVPHLIAPEEFYVEQPADAPIAGVPGFPMARLAESQAEDVQRVALFVAENGTFADEESVGFGSLSSIRYTFIDGRTLYVSTTHLSPAALEQTISFSGSAVMLATEGEAWLNRSLGLPTTPYELNFVKNNFIITLTGDVAAETLLSMADQLVFEQ